MFKSPALLVASFASTTRALLEAALARATWAFLVAPRAPAPGSFFVAALFGLELPFPWTVNKTIVVPAALLVSTGLALFVPPALEVFFEAAFFVSSLEVFAVAFLFKAPLPLAIIALVPSTVIQVGAVSKVEPGQFPRQASEGVDESRRCSRPK